MLHIWNQRNIVYQLYFNKKENYNFTTHRWLFSKKWKTCLQGRREIGTLVHCWWTGKMVRLLWKMFCGSSRSYKEFPYDLEILRWGIYSKKMWYDMTWKLAKLKNFSSTLLWWEVAHICYIGYLSSSLLNLLTL